MSWRLTSQTMNFAGWADTNWRTSAWKKWAWRSWSIWKITWCLRMRRRSAAEGKHRMNLRRESLQQIRTWSGQCFSFRFTHTGVQCHTILYPAGTLQSARRWKMRSCLWTSAIICWKRSPMILSLIMMWKNSNLRYRNVIWNSQRIKVWNMPG